MACDNFLLLLSFVILLVHCWQNLGVNNSELREPQSDKRFYISLVQPMMKVESYVNNKDASGAELIRVFSIIGNFGRPLKPYPKLHILIQFRLIGDNLLCKNGVGVGPNYVGQNAHVLERKLPQILLDDGKIYEQGRCWEDICHAILEAHHLIYIIGWSIYHPVRLVRELTRELPNGGELSLGELLKHKSDEVVLGTCHIVAQDGVMQTHDKETKKFFRHSSVRYVLAPQYASTKLSIFKQYKQPQIIAFIGGLDLCDGRYDTPEHRLYSDHDTIFKNDIHNPTFMSTVNVPRQPWHDLHCKGEGQATYDILKNFEQRWKKVAKWREFKLKNVRHWHENALLRLDRISWILCPSTSPDGDKKVRVRDEDDRENWHLQVGKLSVKLMTIFKDFIRKQNEVSIDSGSVKRFSKSVEEAAKQNLICGKNLKVDKSIHTAYVKAIRSSQHFIYIENQYFLGSSYHWPSYKNAGANNLVPMELALKIASKISENERFCVYIVIPMWPEGVPTSAAVQEILFWQGQTMTMMYKIIAHALEKVGLSHKYHPSDYLNFYCLGKREPLTSTQSSSQAMNQQSENNALASVQKFRRFMIYVHAKGMIVDEEYVIMGSANINQRSLDGLRDTEIPMGAYQPNHTWAGKKRHPHGQVYGYRMSLWAEHLGDLEDSFREPQSTECVKRVNKIAKRNWKAYVDEDRHNPKEMRGHLMQYPIHVSKDGKVGPLAGFETFPDVGDKILRSPTTLPDALTT
ncbi:hypothetical protein ACJRO7_026647 [Eucalyptus globulus]|uniref:Phospholipase D n=1 Tax=Eucalyptus globulus TaxID=34317 RepID=A0ABD3JSJ9_EUCGL